MQGKGHKKEQKLPTPSNTYACESLRVCVCVCSKGDFCKFIVFTVYIKRRQILDTKRPHSSPTPSLSSWLSMAEKFSFLP